MFGKKVALMILAGAPVIAALYTLALLNAPILILELTALGAVCLLLAGFMWIGYTLLTEPTRTEDKATIELEKDLSPETINPSRSTRSLKSSYSIIEDVEMGDDTEVFDHASLHKCKIGRNCRIGSFVYVGEGVTIGDCCRIEQHSVIPGGVQIGDYVSVGPNVSFVPYTESQTAKHLAIIVEEGASIGSNSVILAGVKIGKRAKVEPGSLVASDVAAGTVVKGNPAKPLNP